MIFKNVNFDAIDNMFANLGENPGNGFCPQELNLDDVKSGVDFLDHIVNKRKEH